MARKGISPLIAAVMLIAFVISIGGLFAEWSGELTRGAVQDNSERQEELLNCSSIQIEIVDIEQDYSNSNLNVTLRSDNGAAGNVSVTAFPSLAADFVELTSAGQIEVVSLDVSEQQDSIEAASQSCNIRISRDLE